MKKFILMGALALGLALTAGQEAKAWVNFKFGVGMNMQLQSGGNNLLWGAFRNGQVPGPEAYGPGGFYPGHGQGSEFPYFGQGVPVSPAAPAAALPSTAPSTAPAATSAPAQQTYWNGGSNPYYSTGYSPSAYSYTPNYYYPNYYYAPSYWYGR